MIINKYGSSRNGEKWIDSRGIKGVQVAGFGDGLDMGSGRRGNVKDEFILGF